MGIGIIYLRTFRRCTSCCIQMNAYIYIGSNTFCIVNTFFIARFRTVRSREGTFSTGSCHINRNTGIIFQLTLAILCNFECQILFFQAVSTCSRMCIIMSGIQYNNQIVICLICCYASVCNGPHVGCANY